MPIGRRGGDGVVVDAHRGGDAEGGASGAGRGWRGSDGGHGGGRDDHMACIAGREGGAAKEVRQRDTATR